MFRGRAEIYGEWDDLHQNYHIYGHMSSFPTEYEEILNYFSNVNAFRMEMTLPPESNVVDYMGPFTCLPGQITFSVFMGKFYIFFKIFAAKMK